MTQKAVDVFQSAKKLNSFIAAAYNRLFVVRLRQLNNDFVSTLSWLEACQLSLVSSFVCACVNEVNVVSTGHSVL